jgi:sigma-B regulation protein RsbU (phosphoserine phosphatase)
MSAQPPATILFVDGDDSHAQPLLEALRGEGYAVQEAATGGEALRLAREQPNLVILDLHLPDMSGVEVCRRIKASLAVAPILVLHVSGDQVGGEPEHFPNGCADAYLHKPVTPGALILQVRSLLRVRRAEDALEASETRLQDILDHAPVIVYAKDVQGRYLLVNCLWEKRSRLPRGQVIGKSVFDIYPREQAEALLANDRRVLESGAPLEFEEEVTHAEERYTYLSVKFPLRDRFGTAYAVCGISMDISDRKKWERALLDSEALYQSLVESLPVCILRKDVHGRLTFANRAFCRDLGKRAGEVLGKTDLDFYPEELARKYVADDCRVMETGELFAAVESHQTADGTRKYVEVIKSPLRDSLGQTIGTQALFWDVTARKLAEEELARTGAEFRVARRIQQKLFPSAAPRVQGMEVAGASYSFDIGGASYPAEAIGGDYYDYLSLSDGCLGVAIGDVSGHGIGPALLMAEMRAYLRAFVQSHADVSRIVGLVNRTIAHDIEGDRFITLLLARLDPAARTLTYASAGHSTGYVFDPAGTVKHVLRSTAIPVGIYPDGEFPSSAPLALEPGDLVLFLTDGVVEARSPDGASFSARGACDVVRVYRNASARQVVENLYYAVRAFSQNRPQVDDITATVIKVAPRA